jgi:hypothetical protein
MAREKVEKQSFNMLFPVDILDSLKDYAEERGVPTSVMAIYIIAEFLKREHGAVERIHSRVAEMIYQENKEYFEKTLFTGQEEMIKQHKNKKDL